MSAAGRAGRYRSLTLVLKGNNPRFPWKPSTTMLTYRLNGTTEDVGVDRDERIPVWPTAATVTTANSDAPTSSRTMVRRRRRVADLQRLRLAARSSRSGGPSSSGSIDSDHSAACVASSADTPCLSALGWTFTPRDGPMPRGWLRTCSSPLWRRPHQGSPAPQRSAGPQRPASARPRGQVDRVRGASTCRRRSRLRASSAQCWICSSVTTCLSYNESETCPRVATQGSSGGTATARIAAMIGRTELSG